MRAVITGAASGIGRATVQRFLAEGHDVLGVDLDSERLQQLAVDGADTLVADVGDANQRNDIATAAAGCDALVNAAGILVASDVLDVTVEDWRRVFAVNAESVFFLCQQIGPTMPSGASIVNLSSSSAKYATTTEVAVYAATKTTILSITRSFAYRLAGQGVRVNAICPGVIDTPMQDKVLAEVAPRRGLTAEQMSAARNAAVPLGRPGTPAEAAALIWFLCSPESSYMTGQAINLTGGLVTW